MNYTTNYQLPQWVKSDRIMMDDFNGANSKIDTALTNHDDLLDTLTGQLTEKGNCRIFTTTYIGTGTYGEDHPCSSTFPWQPEIVFVFSPNGNLLEILYGSSSAIMRTSYMGAILSVAWTGNTVQWYGSHPDEQLNGDGVVFTVIALGMA